MTLLGLTGREPVIKIENNTTFCSLCSRVIRRGDEAVAAGGGSKKKSKKFYIHPDCALAKFQDELMRHEYHDVRIKGSTRKTRRQPKKSRTSEGKTVCSFCRKLIQAGDTYVLEEKKPLHNSGRNNCAVRFRRVINASKSSLF